MEIDDHHDARLYRDAKQRDIPDPHGHAEVVAQQPLQDQPAGHGIERREDQDHGLSQGVEDHVQKQEDHEEHHGQNDLHPFLCPKLEFIFARPLIGVSRRQLQLLAKHLAGLVYEAAVVGGVEINVDIARELPIFIADHRRTTRERNLGYFGDRYLRPRWCRNQHATQISDVVAEIALVTDIDRIATTAFDIFGNVHAPNPRLHSLLHVGNGQAVFRRFRSIDLHIDVKALRDPLGKNRTHLWQSRQDLLHLCSELLDLLQIWALKLHSYRRLDSCERHIQPILYRHGPGVRQARKLELLVHLADERFVGHPRPPLFARLEHDRRVVHIERSVVGSTVGSSDRAEDGLNFREGSENPILFLQELRSLRDRNTGKRRGHVE